MRKGQDKFIYDLMVAVRNYKQTSTAFATDEEVLLFIKTFMSPRLSYNHSVTSYGLKQICASAIGFIFRGDDKAAYTSSTQFRRVMRTFKKFHCKPCDKENDVYTFAWRQGARDVIHALNEENISQWGAVINKEN